MDLYLLKVKHIYDEEFEECGIFSSKTKMEEGKKKYLAMKRKILLWLTNSGLHTQC